MSGKRSFNMEYLKTRVQEEKKRQCSSNNVYLKETYNEGDKRILGNRELFYNEGKASLSNLTIA